MKWNDTIRDDMPLPLRCCLLFVHYMFLLWVGVWFWFWKWKPIYNSTCYASPKICISSRTEEMKNWEVPLPFRSLFLSISRSSSASPLQSRFNFFFPTFPQIIFHDSILGLLLLLLFGWCWCGVVLLVYGITAPAPQPIIKWTFMNTTSRATNKKRK